MLPLPEIVVRKKEPVIVWHFMAYARPHLQPALWSHYMLIFQLRNKECQVNCCVSNHTAVKYGPNTFGGISSDHIACWPSLPPFKKFPKTTLSPAGFPFQVHFLIWASSHFWLIDRRGEHKQLLFDRKPMICWVYLLQGCTWWGRILVTIWMPEQEKAGSVNLKNQTASYFTKKNGFIRE